MGFAPLVLEKILIHSNLCKDVALAACIDLEVDISVVLWIVGRYEGSNLRCLLFTHAVAKPF